jgi:hypothetical protein
MFQEIINSLSKDFNDSIVNEQITNITSVSTSKTQLNKLHDLHVKLLDEQYKVTKYIELLKKVDINMAAAIDAKSEILTKAPSILTEEISKAVEQSTEFMYPTFINRLFRIPENTEVFALSINYDGTLYASLLMNQVAGSLEEYAKAVDLVRTENRSNSNIPKQLKNIFADANLRSHFWAEKIYSVGREGRTLQSSKGKENSAKSALYKQKYIDTMESRLSKCPSMAPFWELLDKGAIEMSSDIGGTPYPFNTPTNFVQKTINRLKDLFLVISATNRAAISLVIERKQVEARNYSDQLLKLSSKVSEVILQNTEYQNIEKSITKEETKRLEIVSIETQQLGTRLLESNKKFDAFRLDKLISDITNGIELETKSRGRISIGGTRIYTKRLVKRIQEELGR